MQTVITVQENERFTSQTFRELLEDQRGVRVPLCSPLGKRIWRHILWWALLFCTASTGCAPLSSPLRGAQLGRSCQLLPLKKYISREAEINIYRGSNSLNTPDCVGKALGDIFASDFGFFSSYISADVAVLSEQWHLLFRNIVPEWWA